MRSIKFYSFLLLAVGLFSFGCSELQNDVTLPTKVGVHGPDVLVQAADSFHGKKLIGTNLNACRQCHAKDLSGGTASVGCSTSNCHPTITVHTADIQNPTSQNFHGKYIAGKNWDMSGCVQCHGSTYAGGVASPTCNTCHTQPEGPEACNTCHGDFTKASSVAPPRALNNAIVTTDPGVGAHTFHLSEINDASKVACNECHIVPTKFASAGHIDNSAKAEVTFGSFTNRGPSKGSYNASNNTCANTYCHGNFEFSKATSAYPFVYTEDKMTGNNYSPKWTKVDGTEGKCGTCHGLPPTGHQAQSLKSCATCHTGVVNNLGKIIDPTKHINGKVNVFGS